MNRIAILGGTGMAGNVAVMYLEEQGYDVYHTAIDAKETSKSKALDATDTKALSQWLESVNPDVIFNCIGLLQKDSDLRPDVAILLNSYLPKYLEKKYKDEKVKLIHLSTDCVFSGKRGGYTETDILDGETIYDRTKALGEINNDKDLTFRMSIIGLDKNAGGVGLFNWFMGQHGEIKGYAKAMWSGITTIELAGAVDAAIKQNLTGLYHLVPKEPIDKYNLLVLFQKEFNKSNVKITPFDGFVVDKTLISTRNDFNFEVREYSEQVKDMYNWIKNHRKLYKHYDLNR